TAKEGGVCMVINRSCCAYVNNTQRIETDLQAMWEQAKVLHLVSMDDTSLGVLDLREKPMGWLLNLAWLKQLFIVCVLVLLVFACIMICIPCFMSCLQ
ncbi:ERVV2 protein, partial [Odontophorus gujanensis]|nr:ERVV2 protein [Odontophorus gujanensis]